MSDLTIPNRYESLEQLFGQEVRPLIVAIDADLKQLTALRDRARTQNGGLLNRGGLPTARRSQHEAHAAAIHMPDEFAPVVKVPLEVDLRGAMNWLTSHVPAPLPGKTGALTIELTAVQAPP
jgi:hypothetical protein